MLYPVDVATETQVASWLKQRSFIIDCVGEGSGFAEQDK